jgi:hypothetical protein
MFPVLGPGAVPVAGYLIEGLVIKSICQLFSLKSAYFVQIRGFIPDKIGI